MNAIEQPVEPVECRAVAEDENYLKSAARDTVVYIFEKVSCRVKSSKAWSKRTYKSGQHDNANGMHSYRLQCLQCFKATPMMKDEVEQKVRLNER